MELESAQGSYAVANLKARRGPRLRRPIGIVAVIIWSTLSVVLCFLLWWFLTAGEAEARIMSPTLLPSPRETFGQFRSLWFDGADPQFACDAPPRDGRVRAGLGRRGAAGHSGRLLLLDPGLSCALVIFGRNIPLAALIPLTFFFFGIGESQKVMFIFISCVAFVIADVTVAISDISSRYLDTAYTLGANSWQAIMKVLVPLAMPAVFDSARLLFGLAFGYIMLAELVRFGNELGGLGNLILVAQRRGPREHIYLIVLIIPIVALVIDRFLYFLQVQLFPYRYGGYGLLNRGLRGAVRMG